MSKKDGKLGRGKWLRVKEPIRVRFEKKFTKVDGGCWEWDACKNEYGYGVFSYEGKPMQAHRVSWEIYVGSKPDNMCVLHRCDNPGCVNPAHLFLGTRTDNANDRDNKGRVQHGEKHYNAKLTEAKVIEIRSRYAAGERQCDMACEYGVDPAAISLIVNRHTWAKS